MSYPTKHTPVTFNRRQFVRGLALTSVAASVATRIPSASAQTSLNALNMAPPSARLNAMPNMQQTILTGNEFDLTIAKKTVNITGTPTTATLVNGSLPAPTLVWQEGETVTLRVKNELDMTSSIHWHGIILPTGMDGVPGFSFNGIQPGETFTYQFTVQQNGTYWYHSHSDYQEQTGVYGAIVILPKQEQPIAADYDFVIQLSDWSDTPPHTLYANLKKMGAYYNYHQRTVGDFWHELQQKGFSQAWKERSMWNVMRMSDRDIADISGATYTYLMNGLSPNAHWRAVVKAQQKVRLRFINSAAMTFFDIQIPGLKMTVVAADGNLIQPVEVDEFRIGVAETYDVIVTPDTDKQAYAIFAQAIDRSGYAIGSITGDARQIATTPAMDPPPILSMQDMGMNHSMSGMAHNDHTGGKDGISPMSHEVARADKASSVDAVGTSNALIPPMDMAHHDPAHTSNPPPSQPTSAISSKPDMNTHEMDHSSHDLSAGMQMDGFEAGSEHHSAQSFENNFENNFEHGVIDAEHIPMDMHPNLPQMTVPKKEGPQIDMRATHPQYRLDDPGVGLRDNGRRVLTYADLKNFYATRHEPKPTKALTLHLTGNMERYMWSIDGIPFSGAPPLRFNYGERIRITLINDTMMNHPMHLHGVWSDLETGDENHIPRKHTIIVQPGAQISYRVTMNARGDWAFHCHMLYHMMGMFRRVQIR